MKKFITHFGIIFILLTLLFVGMTPQHTVNAIEGYSIDVVSTIGDYSDIGQFNVDGVAIISNAIGQEYKYGLVDYSGQIILEPIYSWIEIIDDHLFIINDSQVNTSNQFQSTYGLYSSKTRSFSLEPIYKWIPYNIKDLNLVPLEIEGINRAFLFSNKDDMFKPISIPTAVQLHDSGFINYRKLNPDVLLMVSGTSDADRVFWLADIYGNRIEDRVIDYADGYYIKGETFVLDYSNNTLYKIIKSDGQTSLLKVNSSQPDDRFELVSREGFAIYSGFEERYKLYFNDETKEVINQLDFNYPGYSTFQDEVNSKIGLKDSNGTIVVNAIYDSINFSEIVNGYELNIYEKIFADDVHFAEVWKTGYYLPANNQLIEAQYSSFTHSLAQKGYTLVEKYDGTAFYTNTSGPNSNEEATWANKTFGLIDDDLNWIITPDHGYVDIERKSNDDYAFYKSTFWKTGLVSLNPDTIDKKITDAVYDVFFLGNPNDVYSQNTSQQSPTFDSDGFVKVGINKENGLNVGLASRNQLEVEANYKDVMYKNGYFYLFNFDGSWDIKKHNDDSVLIHIPTIEAKNIESIELVGLNMEYIIVETKVNDDINNYTEVGVLNRDDLSEYLPYQFRSIVYNEQKWIIEKYVEPSIFTGVYDLDLNEVVPLSPKYSSISQFSEGYAIGQSSDSLINNNSMKSNLLYDLFFLPVRAIEPTNIIDILDSNGNVVLSLGEEYLSATIIGKYDNLIKLLLKGENGFRIANLNVPVTYVAPIINGAVNNGIYSNPITITFSNASAKLNGFNFTSGSTVTENGVYELIITDMNDNDSVISFILDKETPIINGITNGATYSSSITITFNEGTGLLNGLSFISGTTLSTVGSHTLIVTDIAGNQTKVNFNIKAPVSGTGTPIPSTNTNSPTASTDPVTEIETNDNVGSASSSQSIVSNKPITPNLLQEPTFADNIKTISRFLNSSDSISDDQFRNILKELIKVDSTFFVELTEDEVFLLEHKILNLYKDDFKLTTVGNLEINITGISLISSLERLLEGEKIELLVEAKEVINPDDQSLINAFIDENNLELEMTFSIDISLFQIIDNQSEQLKVLDHPITISLPIPSKFKGLKEFEVLRIHNGIISRIPVSINEVDNTFSFSSDQFSTFSLISKSKITSLLVQPEEKESSNLIVWLGGSVLILLFALLAFIYRRKISNNL